MVNAPLTSRSSLPGLDYEFVDPSLLEQALTHRSHGSRHYERLEFLGDGLLNFVAAELLYRLKDKASEGDLSRLRARIVRDTTLTEIAQDLHLGDHLNLGEGELKSGGFLRGSILADALEAIFGAIYLDSDFETARGVIARLLAERIDALPEAEALKDSKTRLQELLQGRGAPLPEYRLVAESGADHAKRFRVACLVALLPGPVEAEAGGRRKAEQAAATLALEAIRARDTGGDNE